MSKIPYLITCIFVFLFFINGSAQTDAVPVKKDSIKNEAKYFELSLGQTLLFISDARLDLIKSKASIIVPTNAKLFFIEFRPTKKLKIPFFVNLPTQSKQLIKNSALVYERASPTFGTGIQFRLFKFNIAKKSAIEMEAGPLAGFLINQNSVIRFSPIVASRLRFIRNSDMVIYLGSSYSIGINVFGVISGIGYVF